MIKDSLVNLSRTLDKVWFGKKSFETPELYKKIGINHFRKYSIPTGEFWWNSLMFPMRWVRTGSEESLRHMLTTTKLIEGLHAGLGVGLIGFAADLYQKGQSELATAVTAINFLGNGPGILLSRYNRLRTSAALERMERLHKPKPTSLRDYYPSFGTDDWLNDHVIKETLSALGNDGFIPKVA